MESYNSDKEETIERLEGELVRLKRLNAKLYECCQERDNEILRQARELYAKTEVNNELQRTLEEVKNDALSAWPMVKYQNEKLAIDLRKSQVELAQLGAKNKTLSALNTELQKQLEDAEICESCTKTSYTSALRLHTRQNHQDKVDKAFSPPGSDDENKITLSNSDLERQKAITVQTQHAEAVYCDKCKFITDNEDDLRIHRSDSHDCTDLSEPLTNCETQDNHSANSPKKVLELARDINQSSGELEELCQEKETVIYSCTECAVTFPERKQLEKHIQENHIKYCPICNEACSSISSLDNHMSLAHSPHCNTCNINFTSAPELKEHLSLEHRRNTSKFTCNVCQKEFENQNSLQDHIQKEHAQCNNIQCPKCQLDFESQATLANHVVEAHTQNHQPEEDYPIVQTQATGEGSSQIS